MSTILHWAYEMSWRVQIETIDSSKTEPLESLNDPLEGRANPYRFHDEKLPVSPKIFPEFCLCTTAAMQQHMHTSGSPTICSMPHQS